MDEKTHARLVALSTDDGLLEALRSAMRPGTRAWTIELPPGTPILTANHRNNRYAAQRRINELQEAAIHLARAHRLPEIPRAVVLVTYAPPPRLKRDRHPFASERIEDSENLQPTAKALVDGFRKAGVFPHGDSRKYVGWVNCVVLPGSHPRGQVTVHITEVAGEAPELPAPP